MKWRGRDKDIIVRKRVVDLEREMKDIKHRMGKLKREVTS